QNQGDVNDALGYKKKAIVVTSNPLALVAEKTKVTKRKEKVKVQTVSEGSSDDDISDLKKITTLLAKAFNRKKYYSKPTNNNLRTSSAYSSANKKPVFVKSVEKKEDKKVDEKKINISKVKCYNCKKEGYFSKYRKKAKVKGYNNYKTKIYSALCDNDKQHRKKIDEQEILFDKMIRQLVEMNNNVLRLQEKISEKETQTLELEGCIQVAQKKVKIDFENADSSSRVELIPSKIKCANKQTSSLKPYVPTVILEKIIIDLEDEVMSLLEKEKANLKTIESLKSKGFESSENVISESKNQSENDCQVVEKECDKVENLKVIAPGMFKLNVSQSVSSISMSETSCASKNVKNKTKRKRHVKRYSRKDLLSCNNSHLGESNSAYVCNDPMNVSCNSRLYDSFDENNLFIFDDESVRNSQVSKMPFRKKPRDSLNIVQICLWIIDSGCSKHITGNRALLTNFVEKFLGTVRFGNNDFAVIAGYEDVVIEPMTIKKVYYVEGLGHKLFSIGQFYEKGLEAPFAERHNKMVSWKGGIEP
nr:integrase, catalytic region, zinc finger, CCHC-type, peptidase aspartic, catalytic [Tanacetum cinerariifolium]